ncbi:MAG TPA: rod shape-determining protein MreD [Terriglobales bacterium]|nr:rod shape-determining protein MreD [Terriglobales bacterium]
MTIANPRTERIEVYRFNPFVTVLVVLLALILQAFLPVKLHFFSAFDLPLIITIFFAVARRSQISGCLTGAVIGILQDSLAHQPLGVFGIAKSVIGYAASSLGAKIDVENPGSRLLMTAGFYLVHEAIYMAIARGLVNMDRQWMWGHELRNAVANAVLAIVIFAILDKFKQQ